MGDEMTDENKSKWEYTAIAEYIYKNLGYRLDDTMDWEWYVTVRNTINGVIDMIIQMEKGEFPGLHDFVTEDENNLWIKDQKIKELELEIKRLKDANRKKI